MAKANTNKRMKITYIFFIVLMACLLLRTGYLQIIKGAELKSEAEAQQTRDSVISAKRGTIYDRNMNVLAQSASANMVCVVPAEINADKNSKELAKEIAEKLSEILGVDYDSIYAKTQKNSHYEIVKRQVDQSLAEKVAALELKGVILDEDTKRYYPGGNLAACVIGFTGADNQGLDGIERRLDNELSGISGKIRTAKNANGSDMPFEYEEYIDSVNGSDVILTLDENIQQFTEKYLQQAIEDNQVVNGASAIVMDPATGEILAMASLPSYDLNDPMTLINQESIDLVNSLSGSEKTKMYSEELFKMWRNKAVSDTYEPGSTFKSLVACMALEENVVSETDTFVCTGSYTIDGTTIRCHKTSGHGVQTFNEAIQNSCNPALIQIGEKIGRENFVKYFKAFGMSEATGVDLSGESVGVFHNPAYFSRINLATCSFGQSFTVTPLQMITAVSAIANGGDLLRPYVIKQINNADGKASSVRKPTTIRKVISEKTSSKMCEIMENVVAIGGGKNAYIKGYRVAGKTGTSEKLPRGSGEYIASFIGFAPADDPEVIVLVMLDTPKGANYYGGMIAAPVAAKIINDILEYRGIEPQYKEGEKPDENVSMINVAGKEASKAKSELQAAGFKVTVIGEGEKVVNQMPKSGTKLMSGAAVTIYLSENLVEQKVTVPDLTGHSIADCNMILTNSGLNFKISGPGKRDANTINMAARQEPVQGTEVPAGTIISVEFRSVSVE